MRVLGVACGISPELEDNEIRTFDGHDAAAALIEDGRVLAAIEEERLSRIKHSNFFPARAIAWCLEEAGRDLDAVAIAFSETVADDFARRVYLSDPSAPARNGRQYFGALFRRCLGLEIEDRLTFAGHHTSHAWAVFHPSPLAESLVLVLDGAGDNASGLLAMARGGTLEVLKTYGIDQSLGFFYQRCMQAAGFGVFEEYKAMALAACGRAEVFRGLFASIHELLPEGAYRVASPAAQIEALVRAGLADRARRRGEAIEAWHQDFLAALQETLERIVLHVLAHHAAATRCRALCFSGGVALNSVLNGKILRSGIFEDLRLHPAPHDAGNAVGAALQVVVARQGRAEPGVLGLPAWGTRCPEGPDLERALARWGRLIEVCSIGSPAELLASGEILGWVHGRSELGPRALGFRSVFADPRDTRTRARINAAIKGRESFRPLAPVVLADRAEEIFELPAATRTDYRHMNIVVQVRPEWRARLGAVTHADGTARIQTVSREDHPRLAALLEDFGERTGVPVLLNTSFNRANEPIVSSADDAVACLLNTALDGVVFPGLLVRRRPGVSVPGAIAAGGLTAALPPYKKLTRRASDLHGGVRFTIDSTSTRYFDDPTIEISRAAFDLLSGVRGAAPLAEELGDLWRRRAITLAPAGEES